MGKKILIIVTKFRPIEYTKNSETGEKKYLKGGKNFLQKEQDYKEENKILLPEISVKFYHPKFQSENILKNLLNGSDKCFILFLDDVKHKIRKKIKKSEIVSTKSCLFLETLEEINLMN